MNAMIFEMIKLIKRQLIERFFFLHKLLASRIQFLCLPTSEKNNRKEDQQ